MFMYCFRHPWPWFLRSEIASSFLTPITLWSSINLAKLQAFLPQWMAFSVHHDGGHEEPGCSWLSYHIITRYLGFHNGNIHIDLLWVNTRLWRLSVHVQMHIHFQNNTTRILYSIKSINCTTMHLPSVSPWKWPRFGPFSVDVTEPISLLLVTTCPIGKTFRCNKASSSCFRTFAHLPQSWGLSSGFYMWTP